MSLTKKQLFFVLIIEYISFLLFSEYFSYVFQFICKKKVGTELVLFPHTFACISKSTFVLFCGTYVFLTILLTIIWHKAIKYLYLLTDTRAVRYDDIYRMDEIKSLSFHIMFYRLFRGVAKYMFTVLFHHLDDCDLYTPPRGMKGRQPDGERPELNEGLHL